MPKVMTRSRRERIRKVMEFHENGAKVSDISKFFRISVRMVYMDLRDAKKLHAELVNELDSTEIIGREITFWLMICRRALRDYNFATSENGKIGFLRVATEARAKLQKLYFDVGLLVAVPTKIDLGIQNPFSDDEFRQRYTQLLLEARKKGIAINGL
ncbi:MAG: hypothetical protein ACUVWY_15260 [Desulfosoma sp.]|uniref:hypothetical protein n=1 Tax=Desulfosoma sp. TaxID=2603217 RepID=UPI00404A1E80